MLWVILTMGDRPEQLAAAVRSISRGSGTARIQVVYNGGTPNHDPTLPCSVQLLDENLGIPGGRDWALRQAEADIVCFLDDDAELIGDWTSIVAEGFGANPDLGALCFRLVDENMQTARRHVPRAGTRGALDAGDVATFLGGACAIRRSAYEAAGGYWADLWYGHEELDLSWRMIDRGQRIRYEPDATVFHPRTPISRHEDGWRLTGRNRVWIARRDLPWSLAAVHTLTWLAVGAWRAPAGVCRRSYAAGWRSGWRDDIVHRPIAWRTVVRLARLGRPPVV